MANILGTVGNYTTLLALQSLQFQETFSPNLLTKFLIKQKEFILRRAYFKGWGGGGWGALIRGRRLFKEIRYIMSGIVDIRKIAGNLYYIAI